MPLPATTTTNQVLTDTEISDTRASALFILGNVLGNKNISWQQYKDILDTVIDPSLDAQAIFFHSVSAIVATMKLAVGGMG